MLLQALPEQPNPRPKREGSAGSFVSPLDHAAVASDSDSGSVLSSGAPSAGTSAASQSASGYNFYQVLHGPVQRCAG